MVWRSSIACRIAELREDDPDSSRIPHFERELQNLEHLRAFALPLVETMSEWPDEATWGDWLQRLEGFAPRILRKPEHVLRVLADLRPMAAIGPVSLTRSPRCPRRSTAVARGGAAGESIRTRLRRQPASSQGPCVQGRVRARPGGADVSAEAARGSAAARRSAAGARKPISRSKGDRAELERLLLRLAVGAATDRLYASFPRIESSEARARVPSFYALEIMRAVTGRVPDHQTLELTAAHGVEGAASPGRRRQMRQMRSTTSSTTSLCSAG